MEGLVRNKTIGFGNWHFLGRKHCKNILYVNTGNPQPTCLVVGSLVWTGLSEFLVLTLRRVSAWEELPRRPRRCCWCWGWPACTSRRPDPPRGPQPPSCSAWPAPRRGGAGPAWSPWTCYTSDRWCPTACCGRCRCCTPTAPPCSAAAVEKNSWICHSVINLNPNVTHKPTFNAELRLKSNKKWVSLHQ